MKTGEYSDATDWLAGEVSEYLLARGRWTPAPLTSIATPLARVKRRVERFTKPFRREKARARQDLRSFLDLSPEARVRRIERSYHRLKTRSFVLELLRSSREAVWTDIEEAGRLAEYSLKACEGIRGKKLIRRAGGGAALRDLKAQVYGQLGNTARLRRHWEAATEHFVRAFALFEDGLQDPETEAILYSLFASYLRDRQSFGEALRSVRDAAEIYRELEDGPRLGRTLLKQATILWELERLEEATSVHLEGIPLLDEDGEPETALAAFSNLAHLYLELARPDDALSVLLSSVALVRRLPLTSVARLCWIWVAGRLALVRGDYRASERRLQCSRRAFLEMRDPFSTGRVGLDLARLYATTGRLADLDALLPEVVEQLRCQELHEDAEKALEACRIAVELREARTLSVLVETARLLGRARCWATRDPR